MKLARRTFTALMMFTLAILPVGLSIGGAHASGSNPNGNVLGIVRALGTGSLPCVPLVGVGNCYGSLDYNGGPVMNTNKVYTIFWVPPGYSIAGGYQSLINQYFTDVSADAGKMSNTYAASTQYYSQSGGANSYIQNSTALAGTTVDTDPLPALDTPNCPDNVGTPGSGAPPTATTVCVTDPQLQSEISTVVKRNSWPVDNNTEFFMFTAKGVNSCVYSTAAGTQFGNVNGPICSYDYYCAYHSWYYDSTINPNAEIVYANMPYADSNAAATENCDVGQHPNGNDADAEINVTSHEHNESITDPYGTSWWDSNPNDPDAGMETGDLCAWTFGNVQGPSGAEWSNTINGHHYWMQQEWSNADNSCVLSENPELTLTPNIGYPTAPFKIQALFYNAGDSVPFTFQSAGGSSASLGTATADSTGHLTLMTSVPSSASAGTATVSGTGSISKTTGSAPFTVPS